MSNVQLAYLFAKIINEGDMARFDELLHPDYVNHNRYAAPGPDGVKQLFASFLRAMPDLTVTVHDALAVDDKVVGRYTYAGTFENALMGNEPTGNVLTMTSIDIWRAQDGRFVEHWDEINSLEFFVGLGAVVPPSSNPPPTIPGMSR